MSYKVTGDALGADGRTCDNCPARSECRFDRKRPPDSAATFRGGFRGPGNHAQNVSYRLITDSSEQGRRSKEDFVPCYSWVEVYQARARHGRLLREEGKNGEVLVLIGNEGDTIKRRYTVAVNGQGQIVKPQGEIIPALKAAGIAFNINDLYPPAGWKEISLDVPVPPYRRSQSGSYDDEVYRREAERQRMEQEAEDAALDAVLSEPAMAEVVSEPEAPKRKGNPWGRAGKPKDEE